MYGVDRVVANEGVVCEREGTADGFALALDGANISKDPMKNLAVGGLESMVFTAIRNAPMHISVFHACLPVNEGSQWN